MTGHRFSQLAQLREGLRPENDAYFRNLRPTNKPMIAPRPIEIICPMSKRCKPHLTDSVQETPIGVGKSKYQRMERGRKIEATVSTTKIPIKTKVKINLNGDLAGACVKMTSLMPSL